MSTQPRRSAVRPRDETTPGTHRDHLADLAARLSGTSWWDKDPNAWTADDRAAHARASEAEQLAYLDDFLRRPVDVSGLIAPAPDSAEFDDSPQTGNYDHR